MNYCTQGEVLTYNQDPDMDAEMINLLIPAISAGIDRHCRRIFATVTEGRVYHLEDNTQIKLRDDLVSLTSVATNASQTLAASDFYLEPLSGPPYRRIICKPNIYLQYTNTTRAALTVTGIWGYKASVPDEIKMACLIWVSVLYAQSTVHGIAEVSGGDINARLRAMTDKPPVEAIPFLSPFVRIDIRGLSR